MVKSSRFVRRRRVLRRRVRRFRKKRMVRRRGYRRLKRTHKFPTVYKVRDCKFVDVGGDYINNWRGAYQILGAPLQVISLFKEYRITGAKIWFRLRHPPPVRYIYSGAQLVESVVDIHEIFYLPSGSPDEPQLNPRLSSKAKEVTTAWQSVFVRFKDVEKHNVWAIPNEGFDGADYIPQGGTDSAYVYHKVQRAPIWRDITVNFTNAGTTVAARPRVHIGYFYKSEPGHEFGAPVTVDTVEVRMVYYVHVRGRKPLSMLNLDVTGMLNKDASQVMNVPEHPTLPPGDNPLLVFDSEAPVEPTS